MEVRNVHSPKNKCIKLVFLLSLGEVDGIICAMNRQHTPFKKRSTDNVEKNTHAHPAVQLIIRSVFGGDRDGRFD